MGETTPANGATDHEVVIVGGGPAGCSAGVFTARYGLDTVVFDRGRSSLRRCAHLENYLGFPAGIDIETLYELCHDHVRAAGCELRADLVESVQRRDDGGFLVALQSGDPVTTDRVVAATRYGGEYLLSLDEAAMVTTREHDGEVHETFDDSYPAADGTTPIDGLYVASPSEASRQAIVAAGRGARTALSVVEDVRRDRGVPEPVVDHYDWVRRRAELDEEWDDRDRWREWFAQQLPDDLDPESPALASVRESEIDRVFESYVDEDEIERRRERGQERLLDHVDDDLIVERARAIEDRTTAAHVDDNPR
ncbi:thioredoxin reductase [Halomicrobium mukohataei]|uniref:Thioredoxin reductase n=1 Tax=Halomicrobium mukohataei TaxID=57705 RepID=A0A847UFJ0_9EURY|nr:NAD(P)/FAD-dependent oxidoreductase [Halomicrobium mukohataei]NLV10310.1 thioredoxin reductase [Halomicrobium mukohataei]